MLERVALNQTRFRTPGVAPDARGILLGHKGVVLFPSLDRLVAFLRAYGEEGSLDELLPTLEIRRLITPLRTREIMLSVAAESSYRLDRMASIARLAGGLIFTGTSRHFVRYRDAAAPLGYDVHELAADKAELVLYDSTFKQIYNFEREISFRDLVFRLTPFAVPPRSEEHPGRVFVTSELGLGMSLVSYLFRWEIEARAALAEWPSDSAFEDRPRRLYVFEIVDAPERIVRLFQSLPGVTVFRPLGKGFGVQLSFRHPIALDSCATLFDDRSLHLFRGDGEVITVSPAPPFAPVRSLVRTTVDIESERSAVAGQGTGEGVGFSLALRLAPTMEPWRRVIASVISRAERPLLSRLLYAIPPNALASLQIAISEDRVFLLDPTGIEGIPLGTFCCEVADRVYVPAGLELVPRVSPGVLVELLAARGNGHVFFDPSRDHPIVVANDAFGPVSRRALTEIGMITVHADAPELIEPEFPLLQYEEARRFPLWGVPGKDEKPGGGG